MTIFWQVLCIIVVTSVYTALIGLSAYRWGRLTATKELMDHIIEVKKEFDLVPKTERRG